MTGPKDRPTIRQLRFLRALADRTGTTFTPPATKAQASREIERLKRRTSLTRTEQRVEQSRLHEARDRMQPASTVKPHEITGHGSKTKWANARPVNDRDPFLIP